MALLPMRRDNMKYSSDSLMVPFVHLAYTCTVQRQVRCSNDNDNGKSTVGILLAARRYAGKCDAGRLALGTRSRSLLSPWRTAPAFSVFVFLFPKKSRRKPAARKGAHHSPCSSSITVALDVSRTSIPQIDVQMGDAAETSIQPLLHSLGRRLSLILTPPLLNPRYIAREELEKRGLSKLVQQADARMAALAAGTDNRPVTTREIQSHLADFALAKEFSVYGKIGGLSGGQKVSR